MKKSIFISLIIGLVLSLQSCELFNLELQRDYDFTPAPVHQYLDVDAYEFIAGRKNIDFLYLNLMIEQAGLQDLYKQTGYTFLLPNDDMATKWLSDNGHATVSDCSNEEITDYLKSMICEGEYVTLGLGTSDVEVKTLKEGTFLYLRVHEVQSVSEAKEDWFSLVVNGTEKIVRTSNLRPTNGIIHVLQADFDRNYVPGL